MDPSTWRPSTSRPSTSRPSTSGTSTRGSALDASVQPRSSRSQSGTGQARSRPVEETTRKRDSSGSRFSSRVDDDTRPVAAEEENELDYDPGSKVRITLRRFKNDIEMKD